MKYLFLTLFLTVLSFFAFGQSISREIVFHEKPITISSNLGLNDLISDFGQYSIVKNGDSNKPQSFRQAHARTAECLRNGLNGPVAIYDVLEEDAQGANGLIVDGIQKAKSILTHSGF